MGGGGMEGGTGGGHGGVSQGISGIEWAQSLNSVDCAHLTTARVWVCDYSQGLGL